MGSNAQVSPHAKNPLPSQQEGLSVSNPILICWRQPNVTEVAQLYAPFILLEDLPKT